MKNLQVYTAEELELYIRGDIEAWDLETLRARCVCVYVCVCVCVCGRACVRVLRVVYICTPCT